MSRRARERRSFPRRIVHSAALIGLCACLSTGAALGQAEPRHGIASYGEPALGPDFEHFPYADPDAPKGGRIALGSVGTFDSLVPLDAAGNDPWHLRWTVFEPLMARSWDEPYALYGLIAESVAVPEDSSYVEFTLRPQARFSNGDPITVEDVAWTFEKYRTEGFIGLRNNYESVERAEIVGERTIRFVFKQPDREMPLNMGLMPILPKSVYEDVDFSAANMDPPVGSGPYIVDGVEAGSFIRYRRNPDYWGRDLPVNAGRHNFDVIEYIYFRDQSVMFESFIAGSIDLYAESDPAHWAEAYDVPPVENGEILRAEIPNARPAGMRGFVFNTRRDVFADRRVRAAIAYAFDFEFVNDRFYRGGFRRMNSLFYGTPLGHSGAAAGLEAALLAPFSDALPSGALEAGWTPPEGAGDGRNRRNMRAAQRLLEEAGWTVVDGVRVNAEGERLAFEILLSETADERVAAVLAEALQRLGVDVSIRLLDRAQYQQRLNAYDYDMMVRHYVVSLSPGVEQRSYWRSTGREEPRTRNYAGIADPAVDAMIEALIAARTTEEFQAAARALDRVISSGVYFIPFGYLEADLVAFDAGLRRPDRDPLYGYVYIDTWWRAPE